MTKLALWINGLCLMLLLAGMQVSAQDTIPVRGRLQTDKPGYSVDSQLVIVSADTSLGSTVDSFSTDRNGRFRGLITLANGDSGQLTAAVRTCDNRLSTDAEFVVAGAVQPDSFLLNACPRERLLVQGNLTSDDPDYDLNRYPVVVRSLSTARQTDTVFNNPPFGFNSILRVPPFFRDTISVSATTCDGKQITKTRFVDLSDTAQASFTLNVCPRDSLLIQGWLSSDDPDYNLAGQRVILEGNLSRTGKLIDTVFTDPAGRFDTTFVTPPSVTDTVTATTTSCNGDQVQASQVINTDSGQRNPIRLNACPRLSSLRISGSVGKQQGHARSARVYLFRHQSAAGQQPALQRFDSTLVDSASGNYSFDQVPPDTYTLRAKLTQQTQDSAAYMPTYFRTNEIVPGAVSWRDSDSIVLRTRDFEDGLINLHANRDLDGPGFISGYVFRRTTVGQDIPDSGIMVVLQDANGDPVAYQRTDSMGFYEFPNIPLANYQLRAEVPGKPSEKGTVSLSEDDLSATGIIFRVRQQNIRVKKRTGQLGLADQQAGFTALYPNPVQGQLRIQARVRRSAATLSLYNAEGQMLHRERISARAKRIRYELNMSAYPAGIYVIQLRSGDTPITEQIIKN